MNEDEKLLSDLYFIKSIALDFTQNREQFSRAVIKLHETGDCVPGSAVELLSCIRTILIEIGDECSSLTDASLRYAVTSKMSDFWSCYSIADKSLSVEDGFDQFKRGLHELIDHVGHFVRQFSID
ncbi:hypothetical protein [Leuconostoc citreum]